MERDRIAIIAYHLGALDVGLSAPEIDLGILTNTCRRMVAESVEMLANLGVDVSVIDRYTDTD